TANNLWTVPSKAATWGHTLTSTWAPSGPFSIKNIAAYRKAESWGTSAVTGIDGIPVTAAAAPLFGLPATAIGQPFVGVGTGGNFHLEQYSDELQVNYQSDFLTAVVGGM